MKICTICNNEKVINEYYKSKQGKNGIYSQCKECYKERARQWNKNNKEKVRIQNKKYRIKNIEKIKELSKEYRKTNEIRIKERKDKWYNEHKEKVNKRRRKYREDNGNQVREGGRKYYANNKDRYRKSIEKRKDKINQYQRNKRITDINFKIKDNLRRRINAVINGSSKSKPTLELLGCEIDVFKHFIEKKFAKEMNWDNYGRTGWHIDHIIPCSYFDLSKESEQKKCFHYTNLQPLWARDNIIKGDKIIEGTQMKIAI